MALECATLANGIEFLVRARLDVYPRGHGVTDSDEIRLHIGLVRGHPRLLGNYRDVHVGYAVLPQLHQSDRLVEKLLRIGAAPPGVIVWEELPDVRQTQGAQDRVSRGMVDDVTIGVRYDTQWKVIENDAPDNRRLWYALAPTLDVVPRKHLVNVVAMSDAHMWLRRQGFACRGNYLLTPGGKKRLPSMLT